MERAWYNQGMKPQRKLTFEIDVTDFWTHVKKNLVSGCWEWQGAKGRGYGHFKGHPAHRVSWKIHKDQDPQGFYVLHTCDNRCCVNPNHLYLGTQSDNMRDMWQRERRKYNNGTAKHGWETVTVIRDLYATGRYSFAQLGREFKMNRSLVYKIVNNHIWKP